MEFITRCPACQIAFRVTATQLKMAGGKVRCGACLNTFMAEQHMDMLESDTQTDTGQTDAPKITAAPNHEQTANTQQELALGADKGVSPEKIENNKDEPDLELDQAHNPTSAEPEKDSQTRELKTEGDKRLDSTSNQEPVDPDHRLAAPEPVPEPVINELPTSNQVITLGSDESDLNLNATDNPFLTVKPAKTPRQRSHPWLIAACVLAFLALPVQYIYFNVDTLSRNVENRSWLGQFCQAAGCQLPPLRAPQQILSQHLLVMEHPDTDNALRVNAVLINRAPFTQPFPNLLLRFENLQGEVVAERTFEPTEYIEGELNPNDPFPTNQPVKIALEILDPGPEATNYVLLVTE